MKEKPYNNGTWTQARYFGFIRSGLRRMSLRWGPRNIAKNAVRRDYTGDNPRQKYEYQCSVCGGWFKGADVEVDHVVECGELRSFDDLPGFVARLFCEADGFRVLCKHTCHRRKTGRARKSKGTQRTG